MIGGIGYLRYPCTVIGQQRGKDTKDNIYRNFGMAHPEGYRKSVKINETSRNLIDLFLLSLILKVLIQVKRTWTK